MTVGLTYHEKLALTLCMVYMKILTAVPPLWMTKQPMSKRSANSAQKALCWQGPSGIQEEGKIVSSLFHFLTHNFLDDPRKRADRLSQVPTVAVDSIWPCLQFHWFLWKYLSTSFGHHIDFSQDGVYFKSTGAWAAFCIKNVMAFSQRMAMLRLKTHAGFLMKRRKFIHVLMSKKSHHLMSSGSCI